MTDLGALPGPGNCSNAEVINEWGDAAGNSEIDQIDPVLGVFQIRATLWKNRRIIDLGVLEGGTESAAHGINNRRQVVGFSVNDTPDPYSFWGFFGGQTRAFLWEKGVMSDLGTLGGPDAEALIVNDRGQVAGYSYTNSVPNTTTGIPTLDPFLFERGRMVDLGTLGGTFGVPDSLNKRGQVVGFSNLAGDATQHPFLWARGVLTDLGTLGGNNGEATSINDAGTVVGVADLPDGLHNAFLWKDGVMTDLGNLGATSRASQINSKGQVVGASRIDDDLDFGNARAFLWEKGGPMVDLNTLIPPNSDLTLVQAFSINDRGEIAGIGVPPGVAVPDWWFLGHAYVLIPCHENNTEACQDRGERTTIMTQSTPGAVTSAPTARTQSRPIPNESVASFRGRWINRHQVPGAGARD
jgi:probable HAF family extracellular repeat protein